MLSGERSIVQMAREMCCHCQPQQPWRPQDSDPRGVARGPLVAGTPLHSALSALQSRHWVNTSCTLECRFKYVHTLGPGKKKASGVQAQTAVAPEPRNLLLRSRSDPQPVSWACEERKLSSSPEASPSSLSLEKVRGVVLAVQEELAALGLHP